MLFLFNYDVDTCEHISSLKNLDFFMVVLKQFLCCYDCIVGYSFHVILHDTKFEHFETMISRTEEHLFIKT